jgi:hypothetical protein
MIIATSHLSDTALMFFVVGVFMSCVLFCGFIRTRNVGDIWDVTPRGLEE